MIAREGANVLPPSFDEVKVMFAPSFPDCVNRSVPSYHTRQANQPAVVVTRQTRVGADAHRS
jgi:hypothetical protein